MKGRGTNRLLELLDRDGDRSIPNLKRRYRLLCKEAHPDHAGRHEAFLALNAEYREALDQLRAASGENLYSGRKSAPSGRAAGSPAPRQSVKTRAQARRETLGLLRVYAFKFYTRESDPQLDAFIRAAADYDPRRARLLCAYKAVFLDSYHSWLSEGRVYYAHALLIHAVRQLFHYFDTGSERHGLLFRVYVADARKKAEKLEEERRRVLEAFASWLEDEFAEPAEPMAKNV